MSHGRGPPAMSEAATACSGLRRAPGRSSAAGVPAPLLGRRGPRPLDPNRYSMHGNGRRSEWASAGQKRANPGVIRPAAPPEPGSEGARGIWPTHCKGELSASSVDPRPTSSWSLTSPSTPSLRHQGRPRPANPRSAPVTSKARLLFGLERGPKSDNATVPSRDAGVIRDDLSVAVRAVPWRSEQGTDPLSAPWSRHATAPVMSSRRTLERPRR